MAKFFSTQFCGVPTGLNDPQSATRPASRCLVGKLEPIAPQARSKPAQNLRFRALEPRPVCAVFTTLPLQDYFGFFSRCRLHTGATNIFIDEFNAGARNASVLTSRFVSLGSFCLWGQSYSSPKQRRELTQASGRPLGFERCFKGYARPPLPTTATIPGSRSTKPFRAAGVECPLWVIRDLAGRGRRSYLSAVTPIADIGCASDTELWA